MKIQLEYPFNKDWKFGYLFTNREQRKCVHLYKENKIRKTTLYSRYLMSVYLGRYLNKNEEVDHIDNNKTNDILSNLQILTPLENHNKSARKAVLITLICPICKKEYTIPKRCNWGINKKRTCSKKCGRIQANITFNQNKHKNLNKVKCKRKRKSEKPTCHPERKHYAFHLCRSCYRKMKWSKGEPR
jgi:hypothetical protein